MTAWTMADIYRHAAAGRALVPLWRAMEDGTCSCGHPHDGTPAYASGSPLHDREIGKHPARPKGVSEATNDLGLLERWFLDHESDRNVGIAQGVVSGEVTIDIDGPAGEAEWAELVAGRTVPPTREITTGRDGGGRHLRFALPDDVVVGNPKLRPHIDVRGDGGYVVAEGSRHYTGRNYVANDLEPAMLPDWLAEELEPKAPPAVEITIDAATADAVALSLTCDPEVESVWREEVPKRDADGTGYRSGRTWKLAGMMAARGYSDDVILGALRTHKPTVEKYGNEGRLDAEARRALGKIRARSGAVAVLDDAPLEESPAVRANAAPDGHRYTDAGNADRLVAHHGDRLRYVPLWKAWLAWDGRRWQLDHDDVRVTELGKDVPRKMLQLIPKVADLEDRSRLLKWANRTESSASLAALVRLARTTPSIAVDHQALDADHNRLTVANGDIDLVTGELVPHDPEKLSTKLANVRHSPTATAPEFEKFLEQIIPDAEVRAYLQRFTGYCLTGSVSEQIIAIWHGAGANGKSTLINVLRALLGDYAAIAKRELLIASHSEQHPTALADLFGARLATCVELREGAALDEARVKSLTGGDTVAARRMREDWWHFEPTHKLVVATNHRPQIRADDPATWRRVHLVPFEVTIEPAKIDRTLGDRIIRNELAGVLNWAMRGLADWRENGLRAPERVRSSTDEYRADADTVARFMADESVELDPDARCGSFELREIHERWCEDNGENPRSHWQTVQRRLKELGATPGRTASYRFWRGVSVAGSDEDDIHKTAGQRARVTRGDAQ